MTDRIEASASLDPEAWMVELTSRMDAMDYDGVISHARTLMEAYKRDAVDAERYRWMRHRDNTVAAGIVSVKWDEDMDAAIDAARAPKDTPSTKEQ